MSLVFSDTTTKRGIVETIDRRLGTDSISYPLLDKTGDINLALDDFLALALTASGRWQLDDSNHTKDPIIFTNLVKSQRDYHFTTDEQSNLILDFYRVMVADENGVFYDLDPVDQQSKGIETIAMVDGKETEGKPNKYDKTGNGIFIDPVPDYDYANGIKIFINREGSYFVSTDTTKKPGVPGIFHEYFVLRPSYQYAANHGLSSAKALQTEMLLMEQKIVDHFGKRAKDEKSVIKGRITSFR
jgi:hypothetical protein